MAVIRIPEGGTLNDALASMPDSVRRYFQRGSEQTLNLKKRDWARLADILVSSYDKDSESIVSELTEEIDISESSARNILIFTGITANVFGKREETIDSFIEAINNQEILKEHPQKLREFLELLYERRKEFKRMQERTELTNIVLPSFDALDVSIEAKFKFDERHNIVDYVPVLVAYLSTDDIDQRVWFQIAESQLHDLITQLETALEQLRAVDKKFENSFK